MAPTWAVPGLFSLMGVPSGNFRHCKFDNILTRVSLHIERSRDRPKSAPYARLKNSKKTSKCQVFSFTVLENRKFYEKSFSKKLHTQKNGPSGAPGPASASPWRAERGTLPKLSTFLSQLRGFCRKTSKN